MYNNKNKFKENTKSISLVKLNPYYEDKAHYLPYKYADPSFKIRYKGPLMQKDLYILNLMNNRINKRKNLSNKKNEFKNRTEINQKLSPNVCITTEIIFNSKEIEKKNALDDYSNYITNLLKKKFFNFNPVKSKEKYIKFREYLYKDIPTYRGKPRKINNHYLTLFKKDIRNQTYKSWRKIEKDYQKRDLSKDKFLRTDYFERYKNKTINIVNLRNKFGFTPKKEGLKKKEGKIGFM